MCCGEDSVNGQPTGGGTSPAGNVVQGSIVLGPAATTFVRLADLTVVGSQVNIRAPLVTAIRVDVPDGSIEIFAGAGLMTNNPVDGLVAVPSFIVNSGYVSPGTFGNPFALFPGAFVNLFEVAAFPPLCGIVIVSPAVGTWEWTWYAERSFSAGAVA